MHLVPTHWATRCALGLIAAASLAPVAAAQSGGEQASASPAVGVLVLQNGNVVSGVIEQVGDRYRVTLHQGEIGIAASKVRLRAASLPAAYEVLRSQARNTADGHLELAEWCLAQDLFPEAADELLEVIRIAPERPEIGVLRRRLESRARAVAAGRQPTAAGGDAAQAQSTPSSAPAPPSTTVAAEPQMQLTDQPDVIAEGFRQVLPLLLNGCAANRCHGNAGSGGLELFRPIHRKTISRRVLERNWELAVELIDVETPAESLLLRQALTPHGGADRPPLGDEQDVGFQRLRSWTLQQAAVLASRSSTPAAPETPKTTAAPTNPATNSKPTAVARRPESPTDPFDPEPFNRGE